LLGQQGVATSSYAYDLAGKLTRLTHRSSSTVYADYQWTYDAADRITQFISPDGTRDYSYDSRGQLTGANNTSQPNEAYSYDANGNRTNTGYQSGTNNQLLNDGTYSYTYDHEGNRTSRTNIATGEVTLYSWDYHNRLTSVITQNSSGTVTESVAYTYDAYDRRIAKVIDADGAGPTTATTERMVYDGSDIALTFDGTGKQTHRYLYGPGVDQILADETAPSVNWALVDNQGSVRDVIDSNGNVLNHIVYDSYGQVTSETNPSLEFRFGYTGRERDKETGLQYNRARYYDPRTGAFIGQDPIGFAAGDDNLYRYVGNSPINLIDPLGLDGLVISQRREITLSNGDYYNDLGIFQIYIPKQQGLFGSALRLSNAEPELRGNSIATDTNYARIQYRSRKNGLTNPRVDPWGGLLPTPNLTNTEEARGHIVPNILGGSNTEARNFISQNRSINSGGYNRYGIEVNNYLNNLGADYERKLKEYRNYKSGTSNVCYVEPPKEPIPPYVDLTIVLGHYLQTSYTQNYPFRPDRIIAYTIFSDGKTINGQFSNDPSALSRGGKGITWDIQK
jgi:RHS repeat-associated protein